MCVCVAPPRPPEKGSFPLDHFGECRAYLENVLACMQHNQQESSKCRDIQQQYIECRMERYGFRFMVSLIIYCYRYGSFLFFMYWIPLFLLRKKTLNTCLKDRVVLSSSFLFLFRVSSPRPRPSMHGILPHFLGSILFCSVLGRGLMTKERIEKLGFGAGDITKKSVVVPSEKKEQHGWVAGLGRTGKARDTFQPSTSSPPPASNSSSSSSSS